MTYVGTCSVCNRRFACISRAHTRVRVVGNHNHALKTVCAGSLQPAVAGSVAYLMDGRPVDHGARTP